MRFSTHVYKHTEYEQRKVPEKFKLIASPTSLNQFLPNTEAHALNTLAKRNAAVEQIKLIPQSTYCLTRCSSQGYM